MEEDYSIETLVFTFSQHAKLFEEQNEEIANDFKKNYPNEELPAHMLETFNIAKALFVICAEIEKLKTLNRKKRKN